MLRVRAQSLVQRPFQPQFLLKPQRRAFLTPPTQILTASRTLPYPASAIYSIIADVPSYSTFLPYCTSSSVTAWSKPDSSGEKWPSEAKLVVGWSGYSEQFVSKIYCVPGSIVEAVGGTAKTTLSREQLRHYDFSDGVGNTGEEASGILTHLLTRWMVKPFPFKPPPKEGSALESTKHTTSEDRTDVSLVIEYQFSNPVYSAMSSAVADKVAGVMIEAFEKRVKAVLDGTVGGQAEGKKSMESAAP